MRKLWILLVLSAFFIFSTGFDCDFGNGNGNDNKNENGIGELPEEKVSYLLYKNENNQYFVVDPTNPSTITTQIEEGIAENSLQLIHAGDFDNGEIKDIHNKYMVYVKDGKIYKIDLTLNSDLTPEQVSSKDDIPYVCETKAYGDFLYSGNSAYLVKVADKPSDCEDDYDWYYVNMAMTSDDDAEKIGEKDIIMPLYDRENGTIVGWLIRDDDKLRYCDEEFSSCKKTKYIEENLDKDYLPQIKYLGSFTYVEEGKDGGLFNKELFAVKDRLFLFIYNINDIDESVFFEIPSYKFEYDYNNIISHQDGNTIYFTDGGRIVKIDIKEIEGKKTIEIVANEGGLKIKDFALTDERIVYVVSYEDEDLGEINAINSVKKDGKDKKILVPLSGDRVRKIDLITATSNKVYYNVDERILLNNERRNIAGIVEDDDIRTLEEFEYAYWGGGVYPINVKAFNQPRLKKIIKIEQCIHGEDCANNGAIFVFDAEDFNNETTLGVVPLDVVDHEILYGFGATQIGTGFNQDGKGDVFFLNLGEEDSLLRITNTPDLDERSVRVEKLDFITN